VEIRPRALPLCGLVEEIVDLFQAGAQQKGIGVHIDIPDGLSVYADRDTLSTVVRNLVNNAIKFTEPGGAVWISARDRSESILLEVRDTGVGMSPDVLQGLFALGSPRSRAGTSGERGSGLGLLLAHEYVERNGGSIDVESVPGEGSTFRVTLPAAPA
jgi:signal transduction histidine kinase